VLQCVATRCLSVAKDCSVDVLIRVPLMSSVAVWCCSVLQCVTVCYNSLQRVAACCSVLQRVAVCCSVLQCVALRGRQEEEF